ncbi:hypothetical protein WN51_13361 [Melipona quadrifasciata]|uniref:Uncharacterized protein n=1 Tax=Melipona quadrifasciata TaxID=166423 RepID=A0A0M9A3T2_9HYME|nr:hypothetical protein WN51_13361 [Melipona quadrifasciata]
MCGALARSLLKSTRTITATEAIASFNPDHSSQFTIHAENTRLDNISLPSIPLPRFSGRYEDWPLDMRLNMPLKPYPDFSVRKSEGISLSHCQSMNRVEVDLYFHIDVWADRTRKSLQQNEKYISYG